jgi:uncharacterized LabA/DUF88 family protein
MTTFENNLNMAVFCDFENVALGVRDAKYDSFDIKPVLERLLLKGSIVVKKAYCNWERYKPFKATMHEANFELIEIPHVRQSGKNSADIRLVVDALDLCYTKAHVNTFVIISGDSDFSPLVSKLRENAKKVIGVGVKQSTSDLLVANCDEFICYDDLVLERQRNDARRGNRGQSTAKRLPSEDKRATPADGRRSEDKARNKDDIEARRTSAIEIAVDTFDALMSERGDSGKIWASVLKEAIKRRKPDFNESYVGFRTFGNLLEEAQSRGLLSFGRDDKSGAYVYRHVSERTAAEALATDANTIAGSTNVPLSETALSNTAEPVVVRARSGRGRRSGGHDNNQATAQATTAAAGDAPAVTPTVVAAPTPLPMSQPITPSVPMRIPSRARSAAALPPVPTAAGTILAIARHAEAQSDAVPKPPNRKPRAAGQTRAAKADTAKADLPNRSSTEDGIAAANAPASASRSRRARKTPRQVDA